MIKKFAKLILIIIFTKNINSETIENGDIYGGFSSNLLEKILYDSINQKIYLASKSSLIANKRFGISSMGIYSNGTTKINGILTDYCILNKSKKSNPLLNIGFSDFELIPIGMFGKINNLLIILSDDKKTVYLFDKNFYSLNQYEINNILEINVLDSLGNSGIAIKVFGLFNELYILSCSDGKDFTEDDSNTTLTKYSILYQNSYFNIEKTSSINFNNKIDSFNIGGGTVTINPGSILSKTDNYLNDNFFAISGSGTNGIRAVTCQNYEIVPESAVGEDSIIASTLKDIFIKNLSTIKTSSGLSYLIVQAGYTDEKSKRSIFALPLVNDPNSFDFKKLANINSNPIEKFNTLYPYKYLGNFLSEGAKVSTDLYSSDNNKVIVGKNFTEENDNFLNISSLETCRDVVFAKTISNDTDIFGGVFFSQAIIDENKLINNWTNWQRKGFYDTFENPINANSFLIPDGSFFKVLNNSNNTATTTKTIWSSNSILNSIFIQNRDDLNLKNSGIQGIVDIPWNHPFTSNGSVSPSFCMFFGNKSIFIKQTSENGNSKPILSEKIYTNKTGTTKNFLSSENYTTLVFSGGEINGPIITGCLAYSNDDCWFLTAGAKGLFILNKSDGTGFGTDGVGDRFKNLDDSFSWKKILNLNNIKKIMPVKNYVFILTNDSLYRLKTDFKTLTKLFDSENFSFLNAKTSDFSVSGHACLLGTTIGLFRNSNGSSIINDSNFNWTKINLPESNFPPVSIFTISKDGLSNSWGDNKLSNLTLGNIYVLASSLPTGESFIYRFATYDTSLKGYISENSIVPIENHFIKDIPSYFLRTLPNRINISGDGASWFLQGIQTFSDGFFGDLSIFDGKISEGFPFPINKNSKNFPSIKNGNIGPAVYISGYGIWAAPSILGIYTLE